jgi:GntR family transcriptional regulator, arabinose operon transcriptional repressor
MSKETARETARSTKREPVHRLIYEQLLEEINAEKFAQGARLPSEAELCERFSTSRITVAKALQRLQFEGVVYRRAGSGTYLRIREKMASLQFGLLIPDLGKTEIFEPICKGMMRSTAEDSISLFWGQTSASDSTRAEDAERLCRQFLQQKVAGVFFAPIEFLEGGERVNFRLVASLRAAKIPVVLLDRSHEKYPKQSDLDLVGIDNHRAGLVLANHLWNHGARRIVFAARHHSANTILERIAGYETALHLQRSEYPGHVFLGDVENESAVEQMISSEKPDGIICGNDITAAAMMGTLIKIGIAIPKRIRLVGIDDVAYARYLPVPLTTIHQDCESIGSIAMMLMLDRVRNPQRKAIDARVPFELVVRASCGSAQG